MGTVPNSPPPIWGLSPIPGQGSYFAICSPDNARHASRPSSVSSAPWCGLPTAGSGGARSARPVSRPRRPRARARTARVQSPYPVSHAPQRNRSQGFVVAGPRARGARDENGPDLRVESSAGLALSSGSNGRLLMAHACGKAPEAGGHSAGPSLPGARPHPRERSAREAPCRSWQVAGRAASGAPLCIYDRNDALTNPRASSPPPRTHTRAPSAPCR